MTRFYVQDQGVFVPTDDLAQAFAALNFKDDNSLGIGTDSVVPIVNPDNPNWIADIRELDYWGYVTGVGTYAPIYRLTYVGIGTDNIFERFQVGATGTDLVVTGPDNVTEGFVGIGLTNPAYKLDVFGNHHVTNEVIFDDTLYVAGITTLADPTDSTDFNDGGAQVKGGLGIVKKLNVGSATSLGDTLYVTGISTFADETDSTSPQTGAVQIKGGLGIVKKLNVADAVDFESTLNVDGATTLNNTLDVDGATTLNNTLDVDGATTLNNTLDVDGATTLNDTLDVDGATTLNNTLDVDLSSVFHGSVELDSTLIDVNQQTGVAGKDYRLASVGTGVSWRPPGVETQNTIWVSKDGDDANSGLLEGDSKATVGAAAAIAHPGDTIKIRPGRYIENNPIGLQRDVSITGEDIRLVTIEPQNTSLDVFWVRRGCLIENLNFAGETVGVTHFGVGAVAFPKTGVTANSGYTAAGPADEGPTSRWRSPYIRNCTNFMSGSIGMKIDGDDATASIAGADLKSMVCDSFTQYNENGIGVSITNNGYAQLVSIFTINCDIAIYCDTGGSCDLTNSNSSFGNYGLYAVGLGRTEYTGTVLNDVVPGDDSDVIIGTGVTDASNNPQRPFDGQALFFQISNVGQANYPDAVAFNQLTEPLQQLERIDIIGSPSGYSAINPPSVIIRDADGTANPKGPQGIVAEASATVDANGIITEIDVINSGRNYLPTQNIVVDIDGNTGLATAVMSPIYFTVSAATPNVSGITTITFNEFVPYELFSGDPFVLKRISRILTSSHSFEYVGTGTSINTALPFRGALPIKANEVVALDGAQIPFTSTDQKGNFDIGEGIQVDQTTSTIRGRDFSKAIQAEVTPLILALR